jgi:acyl dehydratase
VTLSARQLYFEAVKVGDEMPPLVKPPIDRVQITRYAGASLDFNPLSVDEQLARNSGFPSSLAPGMLAMGFMGELVIDWLRGARLRRFWSRFVKIIWPGDVITSRGRVTDRRFEGDGVYLVDIELWAENQKGELVVRGGVTAQLFYNAEDDNRQRSGSGPLVVTASEEQARLDKGRGTRGGAPPRKEPVGPRPFSSASAQAHPPAGSSTHPHSSAASSASHPKGKAAVDKKAAPKKKAAARPKSRPAALSSSKKKGKPENRKKQKVRPRPAARKPKPKKPAKRRR